MRNRERAADLLDDGGHVLESKRSIGDQPLLGVPAAHQPEHQERPARLSPVVVHRDDVRMLKTGDELRFGFEPFDERRIVGQFSTDDLHRDLTADRFLHRAMHRTERSLADHLAELVAANPSITTGSIARDVTGQYVPLELA